MNSTFTQKVFLRNRIAGSLALLSLCLGCCCLSSEEETAMHPLFPVTEEVLLPPEVVESIRNNWYPLISIEVEEMSNFVSAFVSRVGDSPDAKTYVRVELDNKEILLKSFERERTLGLVTDNYSGVTYFSEVDTVETLVLGFTVPLNFAESLIISVKVDDPAVEKVLASVTYNLVFTGDDEGTGGGDGQNDFP